MRGSKSILLMVVGGFLLLGTTGPVVITTLSLSSMTPFGPFPVSLQVKLVVVKSTASDIGFGSGNSPITTSTKFIIMIDSTIRNTF